MIILWWVLVSKKKEKPLLDVYRLIIWYDANKMKVNWEKFQFSAFGNVNDPSKLTIDKHSIVPKIVLSYWDSKKTIS